MKSAYLLTGRPGVGKTTLIKEVVARLSRACGGFYTEEIRVRGVREGFRIVALDGEAAILASVHICSSHRVSKYGVDVVALERVGVAALRTAMQEREVIVIDEIGKMELYSAGFREVVLEAIESGKPVMGTILLGPHPWADGIKRHPKVQLVYLTPANREQVRGQLLGWLGETGEKAIDT